MSNIANNVTKWSPFINDLNQENRREKSRIIEQLPGTRKRRFLPPPVSGKPIMAARKIGGI
jgi:hypothetical protein